MANQAEIDKLHPTFKPKVIKLIAYAQSKGYNLIITDGYRLLSESVALYKQNPKNAKPGRSKHCYGLAIDCNLQKGTTLIKKSTPAATWLKSGLPQYAKSLGLTWGGEINGYYDPVHFAEPIDTDLLIQLAIKQFGTADLAKIEGNKVKLS